MDETKESSKEVKPQGTKEKLHSIMEAANALTALGDEESEASHTGPPSVTELNTADEKKETSSVPETKKPKDEVKRYLPDHKKPDAAATFPEKVSHDRPHRHRVSCPRGHSKISRRIRA
jgi:hypothetical protein